MMRLTPPNEYCTGKYFHFDSGGHAQEVQSVNHNDAHELCAVMCANIVKMYFYTWQFTFQGHHDCYVVQV